MPPFVRAIRTINPFVWIPPTGSANYKLTVEDDSGVEENITDIVPYFRIENGATEGIGIFEFTIPNGDESYTSKWTGMERFRFYADYASGEPSTLQFLGRIEEPSKQNNFLKVSGRSEGLFVQGQNINKDFQNIDAGQMIYDIFDTYGQGRFDLTDIDTSTGELLSFTFIDTPFWDAIQTICEAAGYDCTITPLGVVNFFEENTNINIVDALIHSRNIIDTGDFKSDVSQVKNQFKITGGTIGGVKVKYTANDSASQTKYGIRSDPINDDGIISFASAKEFGDALLERAKNPPEIGEITGVMLATIQPGESIPVSDPLNGINPGYYKIPLYVHELSERLGLTTTVTINRSSKKLSRVLRNGIQRASRKNNSSGDADGLGNSEIELFDSNSGTNQNTTISGGQLNLSSGQSSGNWTSYQFASNSSAINDMKVNLYGDSVGGVIISYSIDGSTYIPIERGALISVGAGVYVVIRLSLVTGAAVDSLEIQYSLI